MDKSRSLLSLKQKQNITNLSIFKQPLNKLSHLISNDIMLKRMEIINTETVLKIKKGKFYEQLFGNFLFYGCKFPTTLNEIVYPPNLFYSIPFTIIHSLAVTCNVFVQ